jgi:hypothetical protein
LPPVPVKVRAQLGEAVILLTSREKGQITKHLDKREMRNKLRIKQKKLTSKSRNDGPPWSHSASVKALLREAP